MKYIDFNRITESMYKPAADVSARLVLAIIKEYFPCYFLDIKFPA